MPSAAGATEPAGKPLCVALDTSYAGTNPTGVGLYSRRLATALKRLSPEHRVDFRCYGPACRTPAKRLHRSDIAQEWPLYTHGLLPLELSRFRPDVVHATSHIGPLWGAGRLVVTVHDLIFLRRPEDYDRAWLALARALLPRVLRRASAVACDSHATRADLIRRLDVAPRKAVVIYPGIDRSFALPARPPPLPFAYVLCLGPWVRRKNLDVVVRAFAALAPDHTEVRLVITGGPSRGVRSYNEDDFLRILPEVLQHRLVLPGFVPRGKLAALVAGASVLAYPSVDEGFGLPPLEAMAAGVPVVVADTPAVVEATGSAALVAPANDPAAWAERLSLVLARPEVAQRLRAAGLRQSERFTWEACATSFLDLYRRLAGDDGGSKIL